MWDFCQVVAIEDGLGSLLKDFKSSFKYKGKKKSLIEGRQTYPDWVWAPQGAVPVLVLP